MVHISDAMIYKFLCHDIIMQLSRYIFTFIFTSVLYIYCFKQRLDSIFLIFSRSNEQ